MSIILAFLPLLIIILVIMMFVVNKKSSIPKKTRFTLKLTSRLLIVYAFFLIASTIAVAFISPSITSYERVTDQEVDQFYDDIYNNLNIGKEEDVPSKYVFNEWTKKMDGDTFTLKTQDDNELPISIMIERVESAEELVEATLYKGIYVVNQIKIRNSENIEGDWLGDVLTVKVPKQESVSMTFFQYDFTFTQFSGHKSVNNSRSMSSQQYPVLYIKVPKSLKLNVDEDKVHIVQ